MSEPDRRFWVSALVQPDETDGGWIASCLTMPGVMSDGDTPGEAVSNLIDAMYEAGGIAEQPA